MGITNLLQFIKDAGEAISVHDLKGATVAIDAYSWLHKGIFACADKLARGEDSDMYVKYCLKYVDMLLTCKVKVIMVFDGRHLPAKEATEEDRRKRRDDHKMKAAELLILDRGTEAQSHLRQSIDVTHKMALEVIKACRVKGVDCIVAPFEADAQMAYLNIAGYADYVITEDSDLLVFGSKKILYKLDLMGHCTLVDRSKLASAIKVREDQYSDDKFRYMCILSGSDYWPGIKGMGLKKAKDYVFSIQDPNFENALRKMRSYVKGVDQITPQMLDSFNKTNLMFLYQPVYDPVKREVVPLTVINDPDLKDKVLIKLRLKNLELQAEKAFQLALGNLDPFTLERMNDWNPEMGAVLPTSSIWSREYEKPSAHILPDKKAPSAHVRNCYQNFIAPRGTPGISEVSHSQAVAELQQWERSLPPGLPTTPLNLQRHSPWKRWDTNPSTARSDKKPPMKKHLFGTNQTMNNITAKLPTTSLVENNSSCFTPTTSKVSDSTISTKRKLDEADIVEQYSEPITSSTTPRNSCEPVMSGYFSSPQPQCLQVQSPNVRNIILQRKTPELKKERRSLNPFLKSNAGSTSPDLSDGTLKSGLSKILKEGITQKKVVQRVLSPWFSIEEERDSPPTTSTN